jgi:hypothetical protein
LDREGENMDANRELSGIGSLLFLAVIFLAGYGLSASMGRRKRAAMARPRASQEPIQDPGGVGPMSSPSGPAPEVVPVTSSI